MTIEEKQRIARIKEWGANSDDVQWLVAEVERLTEWEQAASEANYTFSFDLMQAEDRLNAVPVKAIQTLYHVAFGSSVRPRINDTLNTVGAWLDSLETVDQP